MKQMAIVTPVLNDWESLAKLIDTVGQNPKLQDHSIQFVCVDDGSISIDIDHALTEYKNVSGIEVLKLNANQGHQRAIALGLAHVHKNLEVDFVVVMDSDGEDRPEDIPNLIKTHVESPGSIIVARRERRSEGLRFRLFYQVYKSVFAMLTGKPISFGNFSLIPSGRLSNVIFHAGIWNNFAATMLKSRVPITFVGTNRGERYFGSSHMNFTSLMVHGLSAISVFTDVVIGRIIGFLTGMSIAVALVITGIVGLKLFTAAFVPGYATYLIMFFVTLLSVALFTGTLSILSLLSSRERAAIYPTKLLADLVQSVLRYGEGVSMATSPETVETDWDEIAEQLKTLRVG